MLVETLVVEQGGPKPIDQELLNTASTCSCGGTCGGDCKCGGTCGGDCGCGGKDLSLPEKASETIKNAVKTTESAIKNQGPKLLTNENLLKLSIGVALGAALYIFIND